MSFIDPGDSLGPDVIQSGAWRRVGRLDLYAHTLTAVTWLYGVAELA